jgi:hypothetical protein
VVRGGHVTRHVACYCTDPLHLEVRFRGFGRFVLERSGSCKRRHIKGYDLRNCLRACQTHDADASRRDSVRTEHFGVSVV